MAKGSEGRETAARLERVLRQGVVDRRSQDLWPESGKGEEEDAKTASRAAFEAHIRGKLKLPHSN
jgi:hypothetical protein